MKTPPFFIGIAILFWGYETNLLAVSILIFAVLESSFFIKKRWKFDLDDIIKISDLNSIILLSVVTFVVLNNEVEQSLLIIQKWLPTIFLPIMTAQRYNISDKIIIATKLGLKSKNPFKHNPMNFSFVYIAITILSTASVNNRGPYFHIMLSVLAFWFFYYNKSKAYTFAFFFIIILSVSGLSYFLNKGAANSYNFVNRKISDFWKFQFNDGKMDPYRALTGLGMIAELKNSGKVIMRLSSIKDPPRLLKSASYNSYFGTSWFSGNRKFNLHRPYLTNNWVISKGQKREMTNLSVEKYLDDIQTLLPIPYGSFEINSSDISSLHINSNNIVKIEAKSKLFIYDVFYNAPINVSLDKPRKTDLEVPQSIHNLLATILKNIKTSNMSNRKKLIKIKNFFNNGFSYTLKQRAKKEDGNILKDFLLTSKKGHCEYFATATALLLRFAGIPSRYITGFAVDEKSPFSNRFIVRKRHAHAWVEAFIDNKWEIVDTTPSIWLKEEKKNISMFEKISDFISFISNKVSVYFKNNKEQRNRILFSILILLTVFLVIKILLRLKKKNGPESENQHPFMKKQHSDFHLIIRRLKKYNIERKKNQSLTSWFYRINNDFTINIDMLMQIYKTHLKDRYDPRGLTPEEQYKFKDQINKWLNSLQT